MLVMTGELVFSHEKDFSKTVTEMSQEYFVGIEVVSTHARDASGFPFVRLHGLYDNVKKCLIAQWEDGGGQMETFAEMEMGNELAQKVWNGELPQDTDVSVWWNQESFVPPF